jgi:APA family basic amino acid/polyamine antiporter
LFNQIFKTKSLDAIMHESEDPSKQLKRTLGAFDVTLLGIGAIVGAGIFATIGTAAAGDAIRPGAGPALMLSFVITGIACGFAALCYAEFAAMVPISGSAYTYSYGTLGELIAWIIGWDLIIEYAVGNVAVAISWANYFKTLVAGLGVNIPGWMSTDYRTAERIPGLLENAPHIFGIPIVFNLLAIGIITLITIILVIGIKESARFNAVMVIIKLIILGFFIYIAAHYVKPENWSPFAPNGWSGIQAGAAVVFFAYIGFDAVSTVAEEVKNPQRDLPVGIIGSLIICTVLYVAVAAVFTGVIPYQELVHMLATQQAEPLTLAIQYANIEKNKDLFVGIIAFGSVIAHTAVLLVFQMGQPRIFFSMARDGLLPQKFAEVHPKFRTPYFATILTGVVVGVTAMFTTIDEMVDLTNIGTLFAFILVCTGIIILRHKEPDRPRSFKVPFVPWVPLLGIGACLYLMMGLPWITWIRFAGWLIVGMMVYRSYGFKHSKLRALN